MAERTDRSNERTRLLEVATRAGVSASTVSLVLAGKAERRRISEVTQVRVAQIAEELNYAPNLLTRSLRKGRTHVLSFFSTFRHREHGDLYVDKLSTAVEVAGGIEGYDILVHCNYRRTTKEIYQFLNGGLSDGLLLFAPRSDDPLLPLLHRCNLPVVIVNGTDPEKIFSSVSNDQAAGLQLVADNLIAYGHRKVAIIGGQTENARDSDFRVGLMRSLLDQRGVIVPDEWMLSSSDSAEQVVRQLYSRPNPPTAVFCWHDRLAYKVLSAFEKLGIRVPDQVSVIGFDGLHWPSETTYIAASVYVDLNELALRAVRMLDETIRNGADTYRQEILPVSFQLGTSLGQVPAMQRSTL